MKPVQWVILGVLSFLLYAALAYGIERSQFALLMGIFAILFGTYFYLLLNSDKRPSFKHLLWLGIAFRLIFLFSEPVLSDDYYRFLWDGQLIVQGINPFDYKPVDVPQEIPNGELLLEQMNSPEYFSIYPPFTQMVYAVAALVSPNNVWGGVLVMRLIVLLAELGIIWLLPKLLQSFFMNREKALIYVLNPLVIVELSGNLHFEGIMWFFILLSVYLLQKNQLMTAGLSWALAAATKLIPFIFLPVFLRTWKWPKPFWFYIFTAFAFLLMWYPFYSYGFWEHFQASMNLYFSSFEFNASVYYLIREVWQGEVGYNPIQTLGPILSKVALGGILLILWRKSIPNLKAALTPMLFALTLYYSLALIVHPWYICSLVMLSLFTKYTFPLLWSALALLSYAAYQTDAYLENYNLIAIEYLLVFVWMAIELSRYYQKRLPLLRMH